MTATATRPFRPLLKRALRNRCPACGKAPMFARFLKPVEHCASCGQDWSHHKADDFPAYIVIILLGHILVPVMIEANILLSIPVGVQALLWPVLAIVLALAMIQPTKGAVIAFQWSRRMHGFAAGQ